MLELVAAYRGLRRQAGFVTISVLTLALASAALILVFSVVEAVLLRPLPYRDVGRLQVVWEKRHSEAGQYGVSGADFLDWQAGASSFSSMTAQDEHSMNLTGAGEPERVMAILSTTNLLQTFGVNPLHGRGFSTGDERTGRVLMLSYGLWQRRFASDPHVIGRTLELNGEAHTVIGVLPPDFRMLFGRAPGDIYLPLQMTPAQRLSRDDHSYLITARLRPGATAAQAQSELDAINARLQRTYPSTNTGHNASVVGLRESVTESIRPALLLLLGAAALLMLLACSNVASLMLARATSRSAEIAIRRALGAGWTHIGRLLGAEAFMLSALAALAGLAAARFAIPFVSTLVPRNIGPVLLPGMDCLQMDWGVVLFSGLICGVTTLVCGLGPVRALTVGRNRTGPGTRRTRKLLAATEVALACLLLIGASALLQGFHRLMRVSPGYATDHRLTAGLSLSNSTSKERVAAFASEIIQRLSAQPDVKSAAVASLTPGYVGGPRTGIRLRTDPPPRTIEEAKKAYFRAVSPGFMHTAGITIVRGREFTASDSASSQPVTIVNEALANRYYPGQDLLGRGMLTPLQDQPWIVIGIVRNVKQLGLDQDPYPEMYFPMESPFGGGSMDVIVETTGDPALAATGLRHAVAAIDPAVPISNIKTMESLVDESNASRQFQTSLMSTFAGLALLLSLSGLYSVMAYLVTERTREIGVRIALGGRPAQIRRMIVGEGARIGVVGITAGILTALACQEVLSSFLFQTSPTEARVIIGAPALLLLTAVLACLIPSWRASRVDPSVALRAE